MRLKRKIQIIELLLLGCGLAAFTPSVHAQSDTAESYSLSLTADSLGLSAPSYPQTPLPSARPSDVAGGDANAPISTVREGEIRPSDAESLFGDGEIPSVDHVSDVYSSYSRRNGPRQCKGIWEGYQRKLRTLVTRPIAASYSTIERNAEAKGLSEKFLKKTLATFLKNQDQLGNQRYVSVIDYGKRSNEKRLFVIDLKTGDVDSYAVAAGKGSDPNGDGYADRFSNVSGSNASSLGCFVAVGKYSGKNGRPSLTLHGFSSTNDNACARATVMHPASYVGSVPGRSWGCPAVKPKEQRKIFSKVEGGGLICAYSDGPQHTVSKPARHTRKVYHKRSTRRRYVRRSHVGKRHRVRKVRQYYGYYSYN